MTLSASPPPAGLGAASGDEQAAAVVAAVAYSDLFDYPLTVAEITRYLPGTRARTDEVETAVGRAVAPGATLAREGPYVTLRSRAGLAAARQRRANVSARLWRQADRHARRLGRLPFVRMVAVTGALAVDNADEGDADIDLLLVAARGRVWTVRAAVTAAARLVGRFGVRLCPNFVLAEDALALEARDLFTARDLAQMVPVVGGAIYRAMRAANPWADELLPNAAGAPRDLTRSADRSGLLKRCLELLFRGSFGAALERQLAARQRRHLERKIRRGELAAGEASFTESAFRGHFDGHRRRIMASYAARLAELGAPPR